MRFKKPKFWDLKKPNFISYILLPFTIPVIINNLLLNKKINHSRKMKTICVGNIYLGGTGKTPTVIKLYQILKKLNFKVSTAKKFYKSNIDENTILKNKTNFITEKNRVKVIAKAENLQQDIVIFDDGLQDNKISYDLQFVCFDVENWIGNGNLIPAGPLREKLDSLKKYDGVFLKNNQQPISDKIQIIKKNNPLIEIFETYYEINNIKNFNKQDRFLIFSGIGNPQSFKKILLNQNFNIVEEKIFPDHYDYDKKDIEKIEKLAKKISAKVITTEKDYVKLSKFTSINIDYLEVSLKIKDEEKFINFIKKKIYEKH